MANLQELLLGDTRPQVVDDCVALVDSEVAGKRGLGGIAVKGAYGVVKRIKPGIIRDAVSHLLDEFVQKLEPFYAEATEASEDVTSYWSPRKGKIADALLGVTDKRAHKADNRTIRKAYDKLRPSAQKHVEAAVPGVARIVAKYS